MLEQFGMPRFLWEEYFHNSMHILNMCHHNSLRDVTHEEGFLGIKHCVDHFRVFGSPTYSYISSDMRKKLGVSKSGVLDIVIITRYI